MEAKEAVKNAKRYVTELFGEEGLRDLGLEEIELKGDLWNITLGFSRPWNQIKFPITSAVVPGDAARDYRVVRLRDSDGEVMSVKRLEAAE